MDGFDFSGLGDFFGNSGASTPLPSMSSSDINPTSTPGDTSGFNFSNSFSANPIANPAPGSSFTPSLIAPPNSLGGVAAPQSSTFGGTPGINSLSTGSSQFGSTSAASDPLAALFASGGASANAGQGPTASAAQGIQGAQPPAQDNSLLSLLGIGTGSGKVDQQLLGGAVSGGGLLANLLMGSPSSSAEKSLKNIVGQQNAQGQQLESYLANGTLPPGAQQWVNQQTAAQQAAIRSKYAQLGMTGSTAESQELNNVQEQATSQMFTIASQLLNTGVQETGASGQLYNYLMQAQDADAKDVSAAIQNFVTSLAGGGSPRSISLNLPGA